MRRRTRRGVDIQKKQQRIHLDNIDIREVLEDLHIHYTEEGKNVSSGWIGVSCPFCDDQTNHLGVNLVHKTVSCFKCGTTGTVIKYLTQELNSFNKAISILGDAVPRELRSFVEDEQMRAIHVELPKKANRKISKYHAGYLQGRGYDWKDLSDLYNFHYCGPVGKWANRIIVPVVRGYRLITFTSIDISDETNVRYKHLADELSVIPIKNHLFGLEHTNKHSVIVVEGLFDMLRFGPGTVCTFGTTVTSEQIKLLSRFPQIKVLFDGDDAGRKASNKIANNLAPFSDVRIFELPEGDDPDKLSDEDIQQVKNS